jgi:hypothetical protein
MPSDAKSQSKRAQRAEVYHPTLQASEVGKLPDYIA